MSERGGSVWKGHKFRVSRTQEAGRRRQNAEDRTQETERRRQNAGNGTHKTEPIKRDAGNRTQDTVEGAERTK